jgi:large subunit ribosomal protein L38
VPLLAEHYGIYGDLFGGNFFVPVVNMNVSFDYDAEFVTPVYYGNKIPAAEASIYFFL